MTCIPGGCDQSCIAFKHSMGPLNCDPCMDLGGEISVCDISNGLDNLFHSIGPKLSRKGHEDYRCFYIQNVHSTFTLRNVIIYFDGTGRQVPGKKGGTYTAIGVTLQDEIQEINVSGPLPPLVGQYMELFVPHCPNNPDSPDYDPSFKVYFDYNITKWAGNFQTAIRGVMGLPEVVVTVDETDTVGSPTNVTFTINYGGHDSRDRDMSGHKGTQEHSKWNQAAKHCIGLISVVGNTMDNVVVAPLSLQGGSPVNTTAVIIPDEITPPPGIIFDYYFKGNPLRIGDLRPFEWVPVWIRRTLPFPDPAYGNMAKYGQMAKLEDNFQIRVDATTP